MLHSLFGLVSLLVAGGGFPFIGLCLAQVPQFDPEKKFFGGLLVVDSHERARERGLVFQERCSHNLCPCNGEFSRRE